MASSPAESPASAPSTELASVSAADSGFIVSCYNRIWRTLRNRLPYPDSPLLTRLSHLFRPSSAAHLRRRWKPSLPLPLHSYAIESSVESGASRVSVMLEDIFGCTTRYLRNVYKSIHFWQSRAEGTNTQKIYFMLFERGPLAFIGGTYDMLSRFRTDGSPFQHISHAASNTICQKIATLTCLRHCLANFLCQVYLEVDKHGQLLKMDDDKSLSLVLLTINNLFLRLEDALIHSFEICKGEKSSSSGNNTSSAPHFEQISDVDLQKPEWTNTEILNAIDMIYQNLHKLEAYLALILSTCQKPKRLTRYWLHYTCGAIGISLCSLWFLRHSSLMGSSDIDNWIHEAKESAVGFLKEHVEEPLISIRDELFETFRRRHKGVMEAEEVMLTSESLHRMLLAFCEQTKGQKLPVNIPDQEMMEIVMARYEKEVMHPLQNLLSGELARAMLIQIQKLKLDLETAMLELDQILKANEINFAILAALPAFFLSLLLLMLVRAWLKQHLIGTLIRTEFQKLELGKPMDKSAEGRGVARRQRRLLVVEVEKKLVEFQASMDQGKESEAWCMYGLILYTLDRLYKAVERHAKGTGEWISLREDIVDLAKPDLSTMYKLVITSRMGQMYDCLLPSSRRP